MSAFRIRVTGTVQGVFYRVTTVEKATVLGITGWVRNCEDGSVKIHAEGEVEKLKQLEEWCKKGPPAAHVESVLCKEVAEEGFTNFATRREEVHE